jgi:hypothetical protein
MFLKQCDRCGARMLDKKDLSVQVYTPINGKSLLKISLRRAKDQLSYLDQSDESLDICPACSNCFEVWWRGCKSRVE